MIKPVTILSCKCGTVSIGLPTNEPAFAAECGCVDCLAKCVMCASMGGPEVPAPVALHDSCLKLHYYHDKLDVLSGKDKLTFTKLREGSKTINCVASCCHTCMLVDNPFYHQGEGHPGSEDGSGTVMFFETLMCTGVVALSEIRWWTKDIPECKLANLKPLPGFYLEVSGDFNSMSFVGDGKEALEKFCRTMATHSSSTANGITFAELVKQCGDIVEVMPAVAQPERPPASSRPLAPDPEATIDELRAQTGFKLLPPMAQLYDFALSFTSGTPYLIKKNDGSYTLMITL